MAILAITRNTNDLTVNFGKVRQSIAEGYQFSGTDEGKVGWVKDDYQVLVLERSRLDVDKFTLE